MRSYFMIAMMAYLKVKGERKLQSTLQGWRPSFRCSNVSRIIQEIYSITDENILSSLRVEARE